MSNEIYRSQPRNLASLMDLEGQGRQAWLPEDLAAMLAHQLSAPLVFDISRVPGYSDPSHADEIEDGSRLTNFGELLHHPRPPLDLLRVTKDFAKGSDKREDAPIPSEIATVLYYATILVALSRHGVRITELGDQSLQEAIAWTLRQKWVDERTRLIFIQGQELLTGINHNQNGDIT